ncbi:MAG: hypothetical protein WCJ07_08355 [Verrucomicrobiota bacterium]
MNIARAVRHSFNGWQTSRAVCVSVPVCGLGWLGVRQLVAQRERGRGSLAFVDRDAPRPKLASYCRGVNRMAFATLQPAGGLFKNHPYSPFLSYFEKGVKGRQRVFLQVASVAWQIPLGY